MHTKKYYREFLGLSEKEKLRKEIAELQIKMKVVYFKLAQSTDKVLLEAAIYELKSLELQYAYLLRKYKSEENEV